MQPLSAPDFGSSSQDPSPGHNSPSDSRRDAATTAELPTIQPAQQTETAKKRFGIYILPALATLSLLLYLFRTGIFALLLLYGSNDWQQWSLRELSREHPVPWRVVALGLRSGNTDIRLNSVSLLGKAGPEAAPALIYALDSYEVIVSTLAESELLKLGPTISPTLVTALQQTDIELERDRVGGAHSFNSSRARACTNILAQFGARAADSLRHGLEQQSRSTRFWCLSALADCEPQSLAGSASQLVAATGPSLRDENDALRERAWLFVETMALSLPQAAGTPLFESITEVLRSPGPGRPEACRCLAKIARISIYKNPARDLSHQLATLILEDSPSESWPAIEALSNLRSINEACAEALFQALLQADPRRKSLAAKALSRLNNPPTSALDALQQAILKEDDRLIRIELESAAAILKNRRRPKATDKPKRL